MSALPPIATLVPHAPPMLAVEQLLECTPGLASVGLTVRDGLFARPASPSDRAEVARCGGVT